MEDKNMLTLLFVLSISVLIGGFLTNLAWLDVLSIVFSLLGLKYWHKLQYVG